MCKAPKPPKPIEPEKPEFLRNLYLDGALGGSAIINSLRKGRSQFRIPTGTPAPTGTQSAPPPSAAVVNPARPPTSGPGPSPFQVSRRNQQLR
jgi:hypothetical protein